jgi:V8-like Glu-specific endopeptidase
MAIQHEIDIDIVRSTPPTMYPPLPGQPGVPMDGITPAEGIDVEAICGATTDWQNVEQYDGTLGVTRRFVADRQGPVGQLQWNNNLGARYANPGNVAGVRWCTGTLIANDLFLTAGHCFDTVDDPMGWQVPRDNGTNQPIAPAEIATNLRVNFNFQVDPAGNPRPEQAVAVTQLLEHRLGGHDFAVVRLAGVPGATFGSTRVSLRDPLVGTTLCIIQHPAGNRKLIEAGPASDLHADALGYNDIDTLGGSSGSGVLVNHRGRIGGVHVLGGCGPNIGTGHNHGVRISAIIEDSPIVRGLATQGGEGTVAFDRILPDGAGTQELSRGGWTGNWTHFIPFTLGGQPHLLSYKEGLGVAAFDRMLPDGTGTAELARHGWTSNWTHFVPFEVGGHPHLMSYKQGVGTVSFDRMLPDGTGTTELSRGEWTSNWTHFVPFNLGGQPHLLSYKEGEGTAAFDRFAADGTGTVELARTGWTSNWTHFVPFELGGQTYLISYKQGIGTVSFDRILPDGTGTEELARGSWADDWTHFVPFTIGGHPHLLSYKEGVGTAAFDRILPDGNGTQELARGQWAGNWTHFVSFFLGGQPHLLSYKG